jgi:hypothetical protein
VPEWRSVEELRKHPEERTSYRRTPKGQVPRKAQVRGVDQPSKSWLTWSGTRRRTKLRPPRRTTTKTLTTRNDNNRTRQTFSLLSLFLTLLSLYLQGGLLCQEQEVNEQEEEEAEALEVE